MPKTDVTVNFVKVINSKGGNKYYRFAMPLEGGGKVTHDVLVRQGHMAMDSMTRDQAKMAALSELKKKAAEAGKTPKVRQAA